MQGIDFACDGGQDVGTGGFWGQLGAHSVPLLPLQHFFDAAVWEPRAPHLRDQIATTTINTPTALHRYIFARQTIVVLAFLPQYAEQTTRGPNPAEPNQLSERPLSKPDRL